MAMSAALDRLYGAAASQVSGIVSRLSESERATLAVFCLGRAHLHAIGLAVAAQCSLDRLTAAAGSVRRRQHALCAIARVATCHAQIACAPPPDHAGDQGDVRLYAPHRH